MSSVGGSPVKMFRSPAEKPGSPGRNLVFGGNLLGLFAYFDQNSSWWRTSQASLLPCDPESNRPSDAYSESYPASGTMRNGRLYHARPLVPHTRDAGSLLSPTLLAGAIETGAYQIQRDGTRSPTLKGLLRSLQPTLTASGCKGPRKPGNRTHEHKLIDAVGNLSGRGGGLLNPTWCEWYMGFPADWSKAESGDSETP